MHEFSSNREMRTYHYGPVETPFQAKDQNEDRHLGYCVTRTRLYRNLSLISLGISFLLLLMLITEMAKPHIQVLYAEMLQNGFVADAGWLTTKS